MVKYSTLFLKYISKIHSQKNNQIKQKHVYIYSKHLPILASLDKEEKQYSEFAFKTGNVNIFFGSALHPFYN